MNGIGLLHNFLNRIWHFHHFNFFNRVWFRHRVWFGNFNDFSYCFDNWLDINLSLKWILKSKFCFERLKLAFIETYGSWHRNFDWIFVIYMDGIIAFLINDNWLEMILMTMRALVQWKYR
jgi:hypothetical protein